MSNLEDFFGSGSTPSAYFIEAGMDIPNGDTVKLGEDGKVYVDGLISTANISTFNNDIPVLYRYNACDLGTTEGLIASLQEIDGVAEPYISFVGYDSDGVLSRLHNAFKLTAFSFVNYIGYTSPMVAPIPETDKVLVVGHVTAISGSGNPGIGATVVSYNSGSITATSPTDLTFSTNFVLSGGLLYIGEDATSHLYVLNMVRNDSATSEGFVVAVNKSTLAVSKVVTSPTGPQSENSPLFRISNNTWGGMSSSNFVRVYDYDGTSVTSGVIGFSPAPTARSLPETVFDYYAVSDTEYIIAYHVDYSFSPDEGQTDESSFFVLRTYSVANGVSDEFRIQSRTRDIVSADSDYAAVTSVKIVPADSGYYLFATGDGVGLWFDVDFGTETVTVNQRSARVIDKNTSGIFPFNTSTHLACITKGDAVSYQFKSVASSTAEKSSATAIGINLTGSTISSGATGKYNSIISSDSVFTGFSGLTVGQVYSETPNKIEASHKDIAGTGVIKYHSINRYRAITDKVMIKDSPEFTTIEVE